MPETDREGDLNIDLRFFGEKIRIHKYVAVFKPVYVGYLVKKCEYIRDRLYDDSVGDSGFRCLVAADDDTDPRHVDPKVSEQPAEKEGENAFYEVEIFFQRCALFFF